MTTDTPSPTHHIEAGTYFGTVGLLAHCAGWDSAGLLADGAAALEGTHAYLGYRDRATANNRQSR